MNTSFIILRTKGVNFLPGQVGAHHQYSTACLLPSFPLYCTVQYTTARRQSRQTGAVCGDRIQRSWIRKKCCFRAIFIISEFLLLQVCIGEFAIQQSFTGKAETTRREKGLLVCISTMPTRCGNAPVGAASSLPKPPSTPLLHYTVTNLHQCHPT